MALTLLLRSSAILRTWSKNQSEPIHISHVLNVPPCNCRESIPIPTGTLTAKPVIRNLKYCQRNPCVTIVDGCEWVMLDVVLYHDKVYLCLLCMGHSQGLLVTTTLPCTILYGIVYQSHISWNLLKMTTQHNKLVLILVLTYRFLL